MRISELEGSTNKSIQSKFYCVGQILSSSSQKSGQTSFSKKSLLVLNWKFFVFFLLYNTLNCLELLINHKPKTFVRSQFSFGVQKRNKGLVLVPKIILFCSLECLIRNLLNYLWYQWKWRTWNSHTTLQFSMVFRPPWNWNVQVEYLPDNSESHRISDVSL
jgi:hypothetical protein